VSAELDVVIPVRDVDDYLAEALESVLAQSAVSMAVCVVDAGSRRPITLPSALSARSDIQLLRSDAPLRAGAARNLGVGAGSAPWISFLDADDVWAPGSRRALIDAAVAASADLAIGSVEHFSDDETARRLRVPSGARRALVPGGIVVRREAWRRVGAFDTDLAVGEFIEWRNRTRIAGLRETAIDATVLSRRVHGESITAGDRSDRSDYLEVVRRWIARSS
jgi:glycosyltransferase involved in cell wall biosynthesis